VTGSAAAAQAGPRGTQVNCSIIRWSALLLLAAPLPARAVSPGKWLVDLARHHGATRQTAPQHADALHILALLRAAARVEPTLAETYYWQYDLLNRLGHDHQALAALDHYVRLEPTDIVARMRWIDLTMQQAQTVEDRVERCLQLLEQPEHDNLVRSDLRRHLAELAYRRGQDLLARQHIRKALEHCRHNIAAQRLAWQLHSGSADRKSQVQMLLDLIAAAPTQLELTWQLGQLLDDMSLHVQAQQWYHYALAVHSAAHPDQPRPPRYLFDLARSLTDAGQLRRAVQICQEALEAQPTYDRARLLLFHLAKKLDQDDLAAEQLKTIDKQYRTDLADVKGQRDWSRAARMAWFYSVYQPDPPLALDLADLAAKASAHQPEALRSLGFAAFANGDLDRAADVLKDLAKLDQAAGWGLARAYLAGGQLAEGLAALDTAARLRYTGLVFEQIAEMLAQHNRPAPTPPDRTEITRLLDSFDRRILSFYKNPQRFIALNLHLPAPHQRLSLTEPWYCRFEMRNISDVTITLGEQMMVEPVVLLSAAAGADQPRNFEKYCMVWLNRRPILEPGEAISVVQSIDIGPLRLASRRTPQREYRIAFSAVLGPTPGQQGQWNCGIGCVPAEPIEVVRPKLAATPQRLDELIAAAAADQPQQRCRSVDTLAALLAEAQLLADDKLDYPAIPVDALAVRSALLAKFDDQSWLVRAHVLDALTLCRLDDEMITSASPTLSDQHWLVRLMAVRLFAEAQGPKFAPVLDRLAQTDPDQLVRQLADSYRRRWPTPQQSP